MRSRPGAGEAGAGLHDVGGVEATNAVRRDWREQRFFGPHQVVTLAGVEEAVTVATCHAPIGREHTVVYTPLSRRETTSPELGEKKVRAREGKKFRVTQCGERERGL